MVDSLRVTVARARPRASRSRAKPSISARRTANKARDRARHQLVNWRSASAYASRVRPRDPGQEPGEGNPLFISEDGLNRSERSGWGSGHRAPPGQAGTGKLGQSRPQRFYETPT